MRDMCQICKREFDLSDLYEYRGAIACEEHIDQMRGEREAKRQEVIEIENHKTKPFQGLDMSSDSVLGKANRAILHREIEIAKKESPITRQYERGL